MMCILDAIEKRVTHEHIRMSHINLCSEHLLALCIFAILHLAEELEIFFNTSVAIWAVGSWLLYGSAIARDFFLSLVVNIGKASLDELLCPVIQLLEIVRSIAFFFPLKTEPLDIFLDSIYILDILLCRVGVIITEIGLSAILLREAKVDTQ